MWVKKFDGQLVNLSLCTDVYRWTSFDQPAVYVAQPFIFEGEPSTTELYRGNEDGVKQVLEDIEYGLAHDCKLVDLLKREFHGGGNHYRLLTALKELLADTQHDEHYCGDPECPVEHARKIIAELEGK